LKDIADFEEQEASGRRNKNLVSFFCYRSVVVNK